MRLLSLCFALLLSLAPGAGAQDAGGDDAARNPIQRRWQSRFFGGLVRTELKTEKGDLSQTGVVRIKLPGMRKGQAVGVWRDVVTFEASASSAAGAVCKLESRGKVLEESAQPDVAIIDREALVISGKYACSYAVEGNLRIDLRGVYTVSGSLRLEADADSGLVEVNAELRALATVTVDVVLTAPGEPVVPLDATLSELELELCHVIFDSRIGDDEEHADLRLEKVEKPALVLQVGGVHEETFASFELPEEHIGLLDADDRDRGEQVLEKLEGIGGPNVDGIVDMPDGGLPGHPGFEDIFDRENPLEDHGLGRGPGGDGLPSTDGPFDAQGFGAGDGSVPDLQAPGPADPRLGAGEGWASVVDALNNIVEDQMRREDNSADDVSHLAEQVLADMPDQGSPELNRIQEMIIRDLLGAMKEEQEGDIPHIPDGGDGGDDGGDETSDDGSDDDDDDGGDDGGSGEEDDDQANNNNGNGGGEGVDTGGSTGTTSDHCLTGLPDKNDCTPNPDGAPRAKLLSAEELRSLLQAIAEQEEDKVSDPGREPASSHHVDEATLDAMSNPQTLQDAALSPYITPAPGGDASGEDTSEEDSDATIDSLTQPPDPEGLDNKPTDDDDAGNNPPQFGGGDPEADK